MGAIAQGIDNLNWDHKLELGVVTDGEGVGKHLLNLSLHCYLTFTYLIPFHATGLILYPLKTSENQMFSDVFRGYRKRSVAWNRLVPSTQHISSQYPNFLRPGNLNTIRTVFWSFQEVENWNTGSKWVHVLLQEEEWGKWPSALRRCNQNRKVPYSNPLGAQPGLGTQLRCEASDDLQVKNVKRSD